MEDESAEVTRDTSATTEGDDGDGRGGAGRMEGVEEGGEGDPLEAADDDDKFVLILYLYKGKRFTGLPADGSVVVSVTFEDTLESNAVVVPDDGRPVFEEEIGFRLTKRELVQCMEQREALQVQAFLESSPGDLRLLLGTQRIFANTARPVRCNPNGSVRYKLTKKRLLNGDVSYPPSQAPCLSTSLVYERCESSDPKPGKSQQSDVNEGANEVGNPVPVGNTNAVESHAKNGREVQETGGVATPKLDVDEGCFFLGDKAEASAFFKLTIQTIHAKDINKALPSNFSPPFESADYFFYFKIFGQADIRTSGFRDPSNPDFVAETVDVRIASSFARILAFFGPTRGEMLSVYLRCRGVLDEDGEEASLAQADVPLSFDGLIEGELRSGLVATSEDVAFFPTGSGQEQVQDDTSRPRVGYVVRLAYSGERSAESENEREARAASSAPAPPTHAVDESEWSRQLEKGVVELEEWKLKQKQQFQEKLKEQERNQDAVLTSEFRQREEERERAHRAKIAELTALADELRATITAVNRRQKQVDEREKAVQKKSEELDRVENVLSAESKRKLASLEQEKKTLSKKLAEAERQLEALKLTSGNRAADKEKEQQRLEAAREEAARAATREKEAALQTATKEKDDILKSKDAYRKAWEKAEAELEELRSERQRERDERLKASEEEVKALRKQLEEVRSRESRHSSSNRRVAFGVPAPQPQPTPDRRQRLSPSRRSLQETLTPSSAGDDSDASAAAVGGALPAAARIKLREMRARRDTLLGTGSYGHDDVLVRLLDDEIRRMEDGARSPAAEKAAVESAAKKRKSDEM